MPYIGQPPVSGDTTKSFRLLDNLASFTLSFDATSSSVVDTSANTLTFANHRFVTAQRVTYADGGGTAIGGLTDGTAYFIIKVDQNTIQLASSASNANNGTAISLSSGAVGSHTLNLAFDGTNTKFKATYANGTKAKISRAGQLLISINGVLQQAQESSTPTLGFGLDSDSTIVFSQAPVSTDVLFGQILADTITNFDTQDNTLDVFTGDGSTVNFNLSKKPASNNDILVTLDGVVQYPTTTSTSNAYSVTESTLTFTAAPADGVAIQVRHIGFAGATSSAVTGLYGRTGNVTLSSSDDDITVGNVTAGIITATSYGSISGTTASFSGNVSIGGTLTYEDVTNIDAVGLITARSGVKFGASGTTIFGNSTGIGIGEDSPTRKLVVAGDTNTVAVVRGATNGTSSLFLGDSDDEDIGALTYNHPSNYLAITVNASERARIDSSGRLLVGSDTTITDDNFGIGNLQVTDKTGFQHVLFSGHSASASNATALSLARSRGTQSSPGYLSSGDHIARFGATSYNGGNYGSSGCIDFYAADQHASNDLPGYIAFKTVPDGSATLTERLRIDSSGNMGLGTSPTDHNSFTRIFDINGSGGGAVYCRTNGSSSNVAIFGQSGSDVYIINKTAGNTRFNVSDAEKMRLDSSGRLLIGTTTEGEHTADDLTVATSGDTGISIRSGTSNTGRLFFSDGTSSADEYRGFISYSHSDNDMLFGTDATERMRIDSDGRLLLGLTSVRGNFYNNSSGSETKFQVEGTTFTTSSASLTRNSNNASDAELVLAKSRGGSVGSNTIVQDADSLGGISFQGADGSEMIEAAAITTYVHGSPGSNDMPGELIFSTNGGSTTSTARFQIDSRGQTTARSNGSPSVDHVFTTAAGSSSSNKVMSFRRNSTAISNSGTETCVVRRNGDLDNTNNSYGSLSDIKLKENVVDANSQWEDIKNLRVRNYNFKSETGNDTHTQLGLIAQEVETVSPGLVNETTDFDVDDNDLGTTTKHVRYSVLYMKAVKALQEAQTRIETLETQQADLLARVAALES